VSEKAFRPGIAGGRQPERSTRRPGRLDRAAHWLHGALRAPLDRRVAPMRAFARRVDALGAPLATLTPAQLDAKVETLRGRLVRSGPSPTLLPECFALVREMARRSLGMAHYEIQLMGGWVMARGMLAEMQTGEGKTLTATLPACAAALAGIPVHVISSNDYLVERDAAAMRPVYESLGLSVGAVTDRERDPSARRAAYACDVTYGTASQIAFDYLRDRLRSSRCRSQGEGWSAAQAPGNGEAPPLLRGLCLAIIDEADSVLIDEARTPLILAGQGDASQSAGLYRRALRMARSLEEGSDFALDHSRREAVLRESGRKRLDELAQPLEGAWTGPRRREEWVTRALEALHLFHRDRDYLVREGRVEIIDQSTGRVFPDRAWSQGLHQMIELKEGCRVTPDRETLARISYQQFFRRYLSLAGMTGTAREVGGELWAVYGLSCCTIPPRRPSRRRDGGLRVFVRETRKWDAVVERVEAEHARGRPVLIGTGSVAASERLSERLKELAISHTVLNARHDAREARIVADAGLHGQVTVATNMAGRGTDIQLAPGVAELGGLHVIAAQPGQSRRIDRQLFGRCGRQGDPGSFEAIFSVQGESIVEFRSRWIRVLRPLWERCGPELPAWLAGPLIRIAQLAEERRQARVRRSLVDLEEYMDDLLAFAGDRN